VKNILSASITLILAFTLFLSGCASSGSAVVTGKTRQKVSAEMVKIYLDAPANYEVTGLVESIGYVGMTDQSRMNRAINELKEQAGKIGANGVLLEGTGNASGATVVSINGGLLVAGNSQHKTARGKAIWVTSEK
jgi:uncharacterized protein YbjQ (UPF0145 family)